MVWPASALRKSVGLWANEAFVGTVMHRLVCGSEPPGGAASLAEDVERCGVGNTEVRQS
jgi:hypothetical protein